MSARFKHFRIFDDIIDSLWILRGLKELLIKIINILN